MTPPPESTADTPDEPITAQVLVIDDEPDHAEVMAEALRRLGHVCTLVHSLDDAKDELQHGNFDLVVTDLKMDADDDGMNVLAAARSTQPNAETIMVTAHGDVPTAKAAIKGGAFDFIEKPLDLDIFRTLCNNALNTVFLRAQNDDLRARLDDQFGFEGIIGNSPPIRQLIATMKQIAPSPIPVLITGESGTGKELVAQAIHNNSKRAKRQFAPLNCAGLSESILEDELFGHVRGAFTGAEKDRQGRFEYANHGTLFLDEVGDMPKSMQAKLLRVLQSGEVVRVGSNEPRNVDIRLVSATNRDLAERVKEGEFREDLYFRIKGVELKLPALRERREDIPLLTRHFVAQYAKDMEREVPGVAEDVQMTLMQYDWPGNVRQLMNVIQNMVVIADGDTLEPRHLPPEVSQAAPGSDAESGAKFSAGGMSLDQLEKQAIRDTLRTTSGNREQAAKMLGIGERTLYRKLKEYGLK
ncbi:MAG: sigma-54 dependent transcriptional regulator [Planctomycetota bacterium]